MSGGSWGNTANGSVSSSGGGGGWGNTANGPVSSQQQHHGGGGILGAIEGGAHFVAQKTGIAAHDLKGIPGGIVHAGVAVTKDELDAAKHGDLVDATPIGALLFGKRTRQLEKGQIAATKEVIQHPLRDPLATGLTVLPLLTGGASAFARAGEVGRVASEGGSVGDITKAALTRPPVKPRLIQVGDTKVAWQESKTPLIRQAQAIHDKLLQNALDNKPESRLASYGTKRLGGSINETVRAQNRMRGVTADLVQSSTKKVGVRTGEKIPRQIREAALRLTSENSTAREAQRFHEAQAAKGVNPAQNIKMAKLYSEVDRRGLLTMDKQGNVTVDAEKFPRLANADAHLANAQAEADKILKEHGIMSEEGLATRNNSPARIRLGDNGFNGGGRGFVDSDQRGRGYVPYKTLEPKAPKRGIAASNGPVIGKAQKPINSQAFTGKGLEQGLVPDNTSHLVASHVRNVIRFVNTDAFRRRILETGSAVRRSSRDILVKQPDVVGNKIPHDIEDLIGRKKSTINTLDEHGQQSFEDYVKNIIPGWGDNFAADKASGIGVPAPKGYRWVDQNLLGDLAKPTIGPKTFVGRAADQINSAVTAATVYFKVGHVGTRYLTNAATNIIQGSANPLEIPKTVKVWRALSEKDKLRALAAAGQHSFQALPHEGTTRIATFAGKGANWWAKHADVPFRFNSIAYEARKAGFDTPEKFRGFLDSLENPKGLTPERRAVIEGVAKRANREQIAYDRLSPYERRFLARGFWFYPWLRGTANFAVNTLLEHPTKASVLGAAGVQGRETQQKELGDVPSYEEGLIPLGKGSHPTVTDFSTFSPFATPADLMNALARPKDISGLLNPAYGSTAHLIFGLNQYDTPTKAPLKDALGELVSPTPEMQILTAYLNRHQDQSKRLFHTTPGSALKRSLVGPAMPRRVNKNALHSAAAREKSGR